MLEDQATAATVKMRRKTVGREREGGGRDAIQGDRLAPSYAHARVDE